MKKWFIPVVIIGILFTFCCKEAEKDDYSMLYGKWNWVKSQGGFAGWTLTPDSEGYTQSIEFQENGQYSIYRNNTLVESGTYTIARGESMLDNETHDMVIFGGTSSQSIMLLTSYSLILREEVWDGYTHTYEK